MSAGKGDRPRPVNKARYDVNYQAINWKARKAPTSSAVEGESSPQTRSQSDRIQRR
jgi:hypothetical protein